MRICSFDRLLDRHSQRTRPAGWVCPLTPWAALHVGLHPTCFVALSVTDIDVPPEEGVRTYLNREGFNATAVGPAAKAFIETMAMLHEQRGVNESHGVKSLERSESPPPNQKFGGARVGDLIQWESDGVLRLDAPKRVRWVSEDGDWVAVEGSETGIPMDQVVVESANATRSATPPTPPAEIKAVMADGFSEWFRAKVGPDKLITINYKGTEEIGPREIEKMISILQAQKAALED